MMRAPTAAPATPPNGLRRSVALFRAFRVEQTNPDLFYNLLARDSVGQVAGHEPLDGRLVLDVGGGPGYFADAFREAGATYFSLDSDLSELSARSAPGPGSVVGDAHALPFRTGEVDVCFSSNLLEHVREPWRMCDEMVRVTRPGGLIVIGFTNWLSPWGGHETSPWHYLGGRRAAERYQRVHGRPPKNKFGESLFPVSVGDALRWAQACEQAEVVETRPRYYPTSARGVLRVPGLRELVTWNLLMVLRRRLD
jgi:SAM-dependent methyltransferase